MARTPRLRREPLTALPQAALTPADLEAVAGAAMTTLTCACTFGACRTLPLNDCVRPG